MPLGRSPHVHLHARRHLANVAALHVHDVEVALVELPGLEIGRDKGKLRSVGRPGQRVLGSAVFRQVPGLARGYVQHRDLGEVAVVAPVLAAVGVGDALRARSNRELADAQLVGGEPLRLRVLRVQPDAPEARPLAPGLPVRRFIDEDGVVSVLAALLLLLGKRVVGEIEDRVRVSPLERAHCGGMLGQRAGLSAIRAHDEDLPGAILSLGRAQERHPASVRRPARARVTVLRGEATGVRPVRVHHPERRDALVLLPVQLGAREQNPLPVRRNARIRHPREVDGVVDAEGRLLRRSRRAREGESDDEERAYPRPRDS